MYCSAFHSKNQMDTKGYAIELQLATVIF